MRNFFVRILATAAGLFTTNYFVAGFAIDHTWQAYLLTAVIFIVFNAIASPIIKLLLLPINLLTLGLLRWLTNVIVLYLFDLLYDGLSITGFDFEGYSGSLIALPPMHLSLFWTLVVSSFILSLTYSLVSTLFRSD
jgi:uncharacterized membrane protein YvlD (DUF360 family)